MKHREHRPDHDPSPKAASRRDHAMAPGKRTLTMGLAPHHPAGTAPVQRRPAMATAHALPARSRAADEPVEDWMAVALRPDLHQAPILRKSMNEIGYSGSAVASAPASGGGAVMPAAVQAQMERALGADFSRVRVHEGREAQAMGALAYTQGTDIHFAPGQYDPRSQRGQELLGHELTHVVQQAQGRVHATAQSKGGPGINEDAALEREADVMGARAARGETAGSQASAVDPTSRGASAPVQRMIDRDAPAATTWVEIQRYLHSTLINERKQTFAEAVEEFTATEAEHFDQVQSKWQALAREAVRQGKVEDALQTIQEIIQIINTAKIAEPDHPNKPESGPEDEQYGTIPQSEQSKSIARALRTELLTELYGGRYDDAAKTYDGNPIQGAWKNDFMLGVLILPDGTVHVSHSGFMGPTQNAVFTQIVTAHGYQAATHDDNGPYTALQDKFKGHLQHDIAMPPHHQVKNEVKFSGGRGRGGRGRGRGRGGRGRGGHGGHARTTTHVFHYDDTDTNVIEKGNPLGLCAAPQGLHTVDEQTRGSDFPAQLEGETTMALTEVLVRNDAQPGVTVKDKGGHAHEYKGNQDVPSCLSCQIQLRFITKLLTDRRRNVVNRHNIRARSGDDITQAVALLKNVLRDHQTKTLVERILGKEGGDLDVVDGNIGKLEAAEQAYRKALDESAKELTAHPELVESGQKHPGKQKDVHAAQRTALAEKRRVIGRMMSPGAYSDAREEAVGSQKPFAPRNQNPEQQARDEETLLARAGSHLDNLLRYRVQEYLTPEQETTYRSTLTAQLEEYRDASGKLAGAGRGDDTRSLNDQIERVLPLLRQSVEALDQDLQAGKARSDERREALAMQHADRASQSATRRESAEARRVEALETGEDELRRAAERSARSTSERQEQGAEEEARRLEELAYGIAQAYGTSIAQALRLLSTNGTSGRYTPERDESKTDHMYS